MRGESFARMWDVLGLAAAAATACFAWFCSTRTASNYYEGEVYGMTAHTHRVYALTSAAFTVLFAAALALASIPTVPLLAVFALVAIFYYSSFARGFSDEE